MVAIDVETTSREQLIVVTDRINSILAGAEGDRGVCTIFVPHTSAAITVNENADPDVQSDLIRALRALVPDVRFDHAEGNSDAHLLSSLIGPSISLPWSEGQLHLGTWQGIYFVELDGPRRRRMELWY